MATWLTIFIWWLAFAASHMTLSSVRVRTPMIAMLGARGFQGLYSLVAFATFIPFVSIWVGDIHGGPLFWNLRGVPGLRILCIALSLAGFVLMFLALLQPSPTSLVPGGAKRAYGVNRVTRHALFMGVVLWTVPHLLLNGWASDVVFFGGLAVFSVMGSLHQDARKRAADDEGALVAFYEETSVVPFGAILAGRQKLALGELSWVAVALGLGAGIALYLFHDGIFR